jgi:GntR family transcriptional regulator
MSFFSVMSGLPLSNGPIYLQLERFLRTAIQEGRLGDNEALPPERDLAAHYGISRITVRKALAELEREGLVVRRRGMGTFVAKAVDAPQSLPFPFQEDLLGVGRQTRSVWAERDPGTVNGDEAMTFGVPFGTAVVRLKRVRYHDGMSVAVEYSTVLAEHLPDTVALGDSFYKALQRGGPSPVRALHRLRAIVLPQDKARELGAETGAPGLFLERRGFLKDGRTIEVTRGWYRGEASDLVIDATVPRS